MFFNNIHIVVDVLVGCVCPSRVFIMYLIYILNKHIFYNMYIVHNVLRYASYWSPVHCIALWGANYIFIEIKTLDSTGLSSTQCPAQHSASLIKGSCLLYIGLSAFVVTPGIWPSSYNTGRGKLCTNRLG